MASSSPLSTGNSNSSNSSNSNSSNSGSGSGSGVLRENVIQSAVQFLGDPRVASAPLARRLAFLESKGLTNEEMEVALARARPTTTTAGTTTATAPMPTTAMMPNNPPAATMMATSSSSQYSWKDAVIGIAAVGGISYGVLQLFKNYFKSLLQVPNQKELETERKQLEERIQGATDSLASVEDQTLRVITSLETQNTDVATHLQAVKTAVDDLAALDESRRSDITLLQQEMEELKSLIPKAMERNKEDQKIALLDLQSEIKSLKGLLLNRSASSAAAITASMGLSGMSSPAVGGGGGGALPYNTPTHMASTPSSSAIPSWQQRPISNAATPLATTATPTATTATTAATTTTTSPSSVGPDTAGSATSTTVNTTTTTAPQPPTAEESEVV